MIICPCFARRPLQLPGHAGRAVPMKSRCFNYPVHEAAFTRPLAARAGSQMQARSQRRRNGGSMAFPDAGALHFRGESPSVPHEETMRLHVHWLLAPVPKHRRAQRRRNGGSMPFPNAGARSISEGVCVIAP